MKINTVMVHLYAALFLERDATKVLPTGECRGCMGEGNQYHVLLKLMMKFELDSLTAWHCTNTYVYCQGIAMCTMLRPTSHLD